MVDQIVDNRTLLDTADAVTNWVDSAGAAFGNNNTETFIEGTASVSAKISSAIEAIMFDAGATQDWSNNHFYFWWNVSTAGKLNTLALGGVRMRFCGASASDYFEVNLAGSDTYSGGFTMSVVDIEQAAASPDGTGGTPPATTAIRYVGIVFDVASMISGNVDNCFVDSCWRLPASTPGIRVEGTNTGTDWTWADIELAADAGDVNKAWGTVFRRNGIIFINTPIRFGANDSATHGFTDSNEVIAWENHAVATGFYNLEMVGGTGTQSWTQGIKTGTGDDATGAQGGVITAPGSIGWDFLAADVNLDSVQLLGATLQRSRNINTDNPVSEIRSCVITGGSSILHADASGDGIFQRNIIANASTADGVAYVTSDDPADIKNCAFTFSDGHAIEITSAGTYTFAGNSFSGYGADGSTDAAIYNNSGGSVTLSIAGGGDSPTVRNGTGASTTIQNTTAVTLTDLVNNTEVRVYNAGTTTEIAGQEDVTSGTFTFSESAGTTVDVRIFAVGYEPADILGFDIPSSDSSIPVSQRLDRNYRNP